MSLNFLRDLSKVMMSSSSSSFDSAFSKRKCFFPESEFLRVLRRLQQKHLNMYSSIMRPVYSNLSLLIKSMSI